jgi:hypothetical protein
MQSEGLIPANILKPPEYVETAEFQKFMEETDIIVNNRYGYVCIFLYRPYYFPG